MATLHVAEFSITGFQGMPHMPPYRVWQMHCPEGDRKGLAAKLGPHTLAIRVYADEPGRVAIMPDPTNATVSDGLPMNRGQTEYWSVAPDHYIVFYST
jgi:hypothetical protein